MRNSSHLRSHGSHLPAGLALLGVVVLWACNGKNVGLESATMASATTDSAGGSPSTSALEPTTTQGPTGAPSSSTTNDTGGPGPGEDCNMFAQNCPDGYKCALYSQGGSTSPDSAHCVPLPQDPKQAGEYCGGLSWGGEDLDDCDRGLMCMSFGVDNLYICRPACLGDPPYGSDPLSCAVDGWDCVYIYGSGVAGFCMLPCDPFAQDCSDGQSCVAAYSTPGGQNHIDFWCGPELSDPDSAPVDGSPCSPGSLAEYGLCGVGRICLYGHAPSCQGHCCTSYCDVNAPNTCALADQGAECIAFTELDPGFVVPAGMEHVGFCGVP